MTTPADVLNIARAHLGEGESPPGSNVTEFGAWYGMNGVSWCAEFVSFCLTRGGFNDGADHIAIPGVSADTSKGWAYVPDIVAAAQRAGRFDRTPRVGDVVTYYWSGDGNPGDSHTGLVESVSADGSINTIEGNEQNVVERRSRSVDGQVKGFFHPPYSAVQPVSTPARLAEDDMAYTPGNHVNVTPSAPKGATVVFVSCDIATSVRWAVGFFPWNKSGGGWTDGPQTETIGPGGGVIAVTLPAEKDGWRRLVSLSSDFPASWSFE